jgi:hypothetical protein
MADASLAFVAQERSNKIKEIVRFPLIFRFI